jgi:hypothetical protein
MAKVTLMTQSEYAKHRGVSRVAVHHAIRDSRITLIEGKIDPTVADIQWAANTRARVRNAGSDPAPIAPPSAAGPIVAGDAEPRISYEEARRRRELAEASIAEMKQAELSGDLIRTDAVRAAWAGKITSTRDALLQIPARLSPQLAAESDLSAVTALLEGEIRQVLSDLSTLPAAQAIR